MRAKSKKLVAGKEDETALAGRNQWGVYRVRLKGGVVESIEGMSSSFDPNIR